MEIPAIPTPIPHSFIRLNWRDGKGGNNRGFSTVAVKFILVFEL